MRFFFAKCQKYFSIKYFVLFSNISFFSFRFPFCDLWFSPCLLLLLLKSSFWGNLTFFLLLAHKFFFFPAYRLSNLLFPPHYSNLYWTAFAAFSHLVLHAKAKTMKDWKFDANEIILIAQRGNKKEGAKYFFLLEDHTWKWKVLQLPSSPPMIRLLLPILATSANVRIRASFSFTLRCFIR